MSKEAEKFIEKYTTKDQNDWLVEKKDIIARFMQSYHNEQLLIADVSQQSERLLSDIDIDYRHETGLIKKGRLKYDEDFLVLDYEGGTVHSPNIDKCVVR